MAVTEDRRPDAGSGNALGAHDEQNPADGQASSAVRVETDVLVVGTDPAGATMALALATYGVDHVVITRYASLAAEPRAHITNQCTMEVLRDRGVEDQVIEQAVPQHLMGITTFCTSITGEELGRLRSWRNDPIVQTAHELASPSRMCDMPQNLMEPVLVTNATARGSRLRHQTEYLSHREDADGVTVTVRDRLRGDTYDIRARYLHGADGGRARRDRRTPRRRLRDRRRRLDRRPGARPWPCGRATPSSRCPPPTRARR